VHTDEPADDCAEQEDQERCQRSVKEARQEEPQRRKDTERDEIANRNHVAAPFKRKENDPLAQRVYTR